jgi:hypothetical protein
MLEMPRVHRLLPLVLLCGVVFASDNRFSPLDPAIIYTRLKTAPREPDQRLAMVRSNFQSAGCKPEQMTEQAVPGQALPNILCTLPGKEAGTIVVAARLDYKSKGKELVVDSATLNLLPLLAQSFYSVGRRYTFVFVAFTGYDKRVGSSYFLSQLSPDQKKSIRGMIFLDHLGRTPVHYLFPSQPVEIASGTVVYAKGLLQPENTLRKQLSQVSRSVNLGDPDENKEFYFTDALNFEREGVMALTLVSPAYSIIVRDFGQVEVKMLRTELDTKTYYETYNLLCLYLQSLDSTLAAAK